MNKTYYIDIPPSELGTEWIHVTTFENKEEAVAWIRKNIGWCDDNGNICLITEEEE